MRVKVAKSMDVSSQSPPSSTKVSIGKRGYSSCPVVTESDVYGKLWTKDNTKLIVSKELNSSPFAVSFNSLAKLST